jgi:hypothetical protein
MEIITWQSALSELEIDILSSQIIVLSVAVIS